MSEIVVEVNDASPAGYGYNGNEMLVSQEYSQALKRDVFSIQVKSVSGDAAVMNWSESEIWEMVRKLLVHMLNREGGNRDFMALSLISLITKQTFAGEE